MISGEGLARTPREVLATLLHEAAHALADARGITDTSRQGRYHNRNSPCSPTNSASTPPKTPGFGWTVTTVPDATASRYADELALLTAAMTMWRIAEHTTATAASGEHQPDRRDLPLRPDHPRRRLHPRGGTHHSARPATATSSPRPRDA